MKKRISLVAMTLLMAVALTACGKTETVSVIEDDETENRTVVTTSVEEPEVSAPVEEQTSSEPEIVETEPEVKPVVPPIEEFEYKHDDELGGMVITKYNGSIPMIIIPDEIDGEPVVAIGEKAFQSEKAFESNEYLESVTIPDSVKSLKARAFAGCLNLADVELPSALETIEEGVFINCGFTEIELPDSIETIGENAFANCKKLETVTIPKNIKTINKNCFSGCENLGSVNLPEGLEKIFDGAFENCNLTNISIPNSVYKILGYTAFYGNFDITISYKGKTYTHDDLFTLCDDANASATSETN